MHPNAVQKAVVNIMLLSTINKQGIVSE